MSAAAPEALVGRWLHAHEEDDERGQVFRPADSGLPPSRGRRALELRPEGELVEGWPGPADVPQEAGGSWALEGETLVLHGGEGAQRRMRVVVAEPDRLILRPQEEAAEA
jgi:hypothetical protein